MTTTYRDGKLPCGTPHSAPYDEGDGNGRVVRVYWLDEFVRPVFTHTYAVKGNVDDRPADALLPEQVAVTAYAYDTPPPEAESSDNENYHFHPDRAFGVRAAEGEVPERTERVMDEEQFQAQLEPVPTSGDWTSVLRQER